MAMDNGIISCAYKLLNYAPSVLHKFDATSDEIYYDRFTSTVLPAHYPYTRVHEQWIPSFLECRNDSHGRKIKRWKGSNELVKEIGHYSKENQME